MSLPQPQNSVTRRDVSTSQAQATPNVRGVEGRRTQLHGQILVGIRSHGCAALSAAGLICTTRGSTPEGWNETLGQCRSTGCITLPPSFQLNSKIGKKKGKKGKKRNSSKKKFPIPSCKNLSH